MADDNDLIATNYMREDSAAFHNELFSCLSDCGSNIEWFIRTGKELHYFCEGAFGNRSRESLFKITKEQYYKLSTLLKRYQWLKKYNEFDMFDKSEEFKQSLDYKMQKIIVEDAEYCNRIQDVVNACLSQGIANQYSKEEIKYLRLKTALLPLVLADTTYDIQRIKMSGENSYMFLCPLHSEKTPSFRVYDSTNSYTCYGCGNTGDVISYLKSLYNISFLEAVDLLLKVFLLKEVKKYDPLYPTIRKYQNSVISDEYQCFLQLGIERMYKYGNLLMPGRTEAIDEYYDQKFQTVEQIKKNKINPLFKSHKEPEYINLDLEEPIRQVQKRKSLIDERQKNFRDHFWDHFEDGLPF